MIKAHVTRNDLLDFRADIISENKIVGEIALLKDNENGFYEDWYNLNLELEDDFSEWFYESLQIALELAFKEIGAASVHCSFEKYNTAAAGALFRSGFSVEGEENHILRFALTVKQYYQNIN